MAKSQYNADSASVPQSPLPSNGGQISAFEIAPTTLKDALPTPTTFVLASTTAYFGESIDLKLRLPDHVSAGRQARQSGNPTPNSID